jgi:uncharacterized protein YgiM (DUF1202 family)
MRLNKEQQYGYNRYLDYLHLKASEALSLQAEAEEKIRKDEKVEIAKKAIIKGFDNETVADLTGLTIEQIEALRNEKD